MLWARLHAARGEKDAARHALAQAAAFHRQAASADPLHLRTALRHLEDLCATLELVPCALAEVGADLRGRSARRDEGIAVDHDAGLDDPMAASGGADVGDR